MYRNGNATHLTKFHESNSIRPNILLFIIILPCTPILSLSLPQLLPPLQLNGTPVHPESVKARVIRMPMIRVDPQLHDPVLALHLRILHIKVLITGGLICVRVLVRTELDGRLVILIGQTLKINTKQPNEMPIHRPSFLIIISHSPKL